MPKRKTITKPTVQSVLQSASQLSRAELEELSVAVAALLEALDASEDKEELAVGESNTQSPKRCGKNGGSRIEWKRIRGYGPYPYLRFRIGKVHHSYYLKELAASTRPEQQQE